MGYQGRHKALPLRKGGNRMLLSMGYQGRHKALPLRKGVTGCCCLWATRAGTRHCPYGRGLGEGFRE